MSNTGTLEIADLSLTLSRYPDNHDKSLQAWNGADLQLLQYAFEHPKPVARVLLINDEFGALACALAAHPAFAQSEIVSISDSEIAKRALERNLAANELPTQRIQFADSLQPYPATELVLMRLPKNLAFFEQQLICLQQVLQPGQKLVVGAMLKALVKSAFGLLEKHIGEVSTSLAQKKARLVFAEYQDMQSEQPYPLNWQLSEHNWQLSDHANVFCLGKFDIGTRFLLDNFPQEPVDSVIDLGCGNGLLGLAALKHYPDAEVHFVDESFMAVASARNNVANNYPQALERCHFSSDNCLEQQASDSAQLVLCNPPFHQQNTVSTHIAEQMFKDAKRCLKKAGKLVVVANRHLPYAPLLKRLFGGFQVFATNNKFVVLVANKR
ncbi:methyltransferase [Aliagarivorans taiwanensis]|uniref:methyltransferase n=1 Tax=Aliagarivorans taiwanensis TaxID=561966 RepID=UPI00041AE091|nr:methyltransferase [Aliagarivorans taiwanensis]